MKKSIIHKICAPLTDDVISQLRAGDSVRISGTVYTARDAAHRRMAESLEKGESLPIPLKGQILYYAGPTPPKPGHVIGSIGPTTSGRMDDYTPLLLKAGLKAMIGKGGRSKEIVGLMQKMICVYFGATGGTAALISKCVRKAEIAAYEDLGPEAVRRLEVEDFTVLVINDCYGGDLYRTGKDQYRRIFPGDEK
jgi:fumarate hydratase subunit beta